MANHTTTEQTEAMRAESEQRQSEIDAGNVNLEDTEAAAPEAEDAASEVPPERAARPKPVQRSPADDVRNAIADRFRRPGVEVPFNGDLSDPEMIYGEAGRAPALEPDPEPSVVGEKMVAQEAPEPAPEAPQKRVLKIRGQDVELTDDEILERARKVTSADQYLEEARRLLEDAKTIKAERAGRDRQPPDGQSSTQDDGQDSTTQDSQERPHARGLKEVIEKIQFGDPEEAADELGKFITSAAKAQADEGHTTRLFNNDLARSQKALADFTAANPDLAKDEDAAATIERNMYRLYKDDILKLGVVDEAQIPTDPRTLANWHRFYRVHGYQVRNTPDLLNAAKAKYEAWRGPSKPQQPVRPSVPRVEVNVNRTERRLAIPNQPTRAVAPRRDAPPAPARTPGSDVVTEMRRARGQLV